MEEKMKHNLAWDPYEEAIHLLGMRMPHGRVQMMVANSKFYQRFPFEAVTRLRKKMGITQQKFAEISYISKRTFSRRKEEGKLNPAEAHTILRIAFTMVYVLRKHPGLFAKVWLLEPRKDLEGKAPIDFIGTEVGDRELIRILSGQ